MTGLTSGWFPASVSSDKGSLPEACGGAAPCRLAMPMTLEQHEDATEFWVTQELKLPWRMGEREMVTPVGRPN